MSEEDSSIRVMLVDDSAVIRGTITRILKEQPNIDIVDSVANGEFAISAAKRSQPEIVILDVEMPVMDGITALPQILEASPKSKVIMCSTLTEKGADISIQAMKLGAVDCIAKPTSTIEIREGPSFKDMLLQMVNALAPRSPRSRNTPVNKSDDSQVSTPLYSSKEPALYDDAISYKGKPNAIIIGSSTGGPQALFTVLKNFQGFDAPIFITQHMPSTFTKILAEHIEQQTSIPTKEGAEGMVVLPGNIYVAPGGKHMIVGNNGGDTVIKLDDGPPENFCKPAVDTMFRSLFEVYGQKMLALILTGMGNDGLQSSKMLVEKGVRVIAQNRETSVVWGMPGAVAHAGICSAILPLEEIGPWVRRAMGSL